MQDIINSHEYDKPRCDPNTGLGERQTGNKYGSGTPACNQPPGQRPNRDEVNPPLSWYQIACDAISMDRAVRPPGDQAPRWAVDDYYDIYRPVDIPSLPGGQ